jgi:hypothetical protein
MYGVSASREIYCTTCSIVCVKYKYSVLHVGEKCVSWEIKMHRDYILTC